MKFPTIKQNYFWPICLTFFGKTCKGAFSPVLGAYLSSPLPACVGFLGTVASLQVWTPGTSCRLLWGDREGWGFLCEAWKPEGRRRCPWSSFWLQPCGPHRVPLEDMGGFAVNQLCPEVLRDSPLAQLCSVSDLPSLPFNMTRWSVCWVVLAGEQNLSSLAGARPLSVHQPWHRQPLPCHLHGACGPPCAVHQS